MRRSTSIIMRALTGAGLGMLGIAFTPQGACAQKTPNTDTPTTQPGSKPPARKLSMQTAVDIGLHNSKPLRAAADAVLLAHGKVVESKTGFIPTLGSTVQATHLDTGTKITLPDATGKPQVIPIVKQDQKTIAVTAALPVDISGLIRAAADISHFQEVAARLDYNRVINEGVLAIKNAYYDILRKKALVLVAQQALQNSTDRETTAEVYLKAGTGTKFDVLRAQADQANAKQNLISANNQVSLAIATLNNVLGLDQNTPLDVDEATEPADQPDFDTAVGTAYRSRPEVLEAQANEQAARKGLHLAKRSLLPSMNLGWNFNYTPDQGGFAPKTTSWAAVASLTIPIFEAGVGAARVEQAHAQIDAAATSKLEALDTVALDVRQSYLAMTEASDRLAVTQAGLVSANEQYRLAQVRYKAGVTQTVGGSPLLEISDAQAALTQAQTSHVNAQYDLQNARARLDHAIGAYAFVGGGKPGLAAPPAAPK